MQIYFLFINSSLVEISTFLCLLFCSLVFFLWLESFGWIFEASCRSQDSFFQLWSWPCFAGLALGLLLKILGFSCFFIHWNNYGFLFLPKFESLFYKLKEDMLICLAMRPSITFAVFRNVLVLIVRVYGSKDLVVFDAESALNNFSAEPALNVCL